MAKNVKKEMVVVPKRMKGYDWKLIVVLAVAALVVALVVVWQMLPEQPKMVSKEDTISVEVSFEPDFVLTEAQKGTIKKALIDWDEKFECPQAIEIGNDIIQSSSLHQGEEIEAQSSPGSINLDMEEIEDLKELRDIILHEATHACKGEPTVLTEPIPYSNGQITEYRGLNIVITVTADFKMYFSYCEEGYAEWAAYMVDPQYSVHNAGYKQVGDLMVRTLGNNPAYIDILMENDFPKLASLLTGTPENVIQPEDIIEAMELCDSTYKSAFE